MFNQLKNEDYEEINYRAPRSTRNNKYLGG